MEHNNENERCGAGPAPKDNPYRRRRQSACEQKRSTTKEVAADRSAARDLVGENERTPTPILRWGDTTALGKTYDQRRYSVHTLSPPHVAITPEKGGEMKLNAHWKAVRADKAASQCPEELPRLRHKSRCPTLCLHTCNFVVEMRSATFVYIFMGLYPALRGCLMAVWSQPSQIISVFRLVTARLSSKS